MQRQHPVATDLKVVSVAALHLQYFPEIAAQELMRSVLGVTEIRSLQSRLLPKSVHRKPVEATVRPVDEASQQIGTSVPASINGPVAADTTPDIHFPR